MNNTDIPGDPGRLAALGSRIRAAAVDLESVQGRAEGGGLAGAWIGQAGNSFRGSLGELPGELGKVAAAFDHAGSAISAFAANLAEFQSNARWCASQIASEESALHAAEARHAGAQTQLASAQRAHAAATDPVTVQTTQTAVGRSQSSVRQAAGESADISRTLANLRTRAATNYSDYVTAVRACSAALDGARHSGHQSLGAWMQARIDGLVGLVERATPHTAGGWWNLAEKINSGAEKGAKWLEHPGYLTAGKAAKLWGETAGGSPVRHAGAFYQRLHGPGGKGGYLDYQGRYVVGTLGLRKVISLDTLKRVSSVTKWGGRALGVVGVALSAAGTFGEDRRHGQSVGHAAEDAAITGGASFAGSVVGATVGTALGTALIPIPGVGSVVGGVVGSALGGWAGQKLGKGAEGLLHAVHLF